MKLIHFLIAFLINFKLLFAYFKLMNNDTIGNLTIATQKTLNFNRYEVGNNYTELNLFIEGINHEYPELTRITNIGNSTNNQSILVLSISNKINLGRQLLKPSIKLVANQYGQEILSTQLLIYLVKFLLENYPHNKIIKELIDSMQISFLFTLNPDNFNTTEENECKSNRKLLENQFKLPDQYDPNSHLIYDYQRYINFWFREGLSFLNGKKNSTEYYYPSELEAFEKWTLENQFVLSLDLHSDNFMGVLYPYSRFKPIINRSYLEYDDLFSNLTPDDYLFKMLSYSYALNNPSMNSSECNPLREFENKDKYPVINSALFNPIIGSMLDYNYFFANCFEISVYLSCCSYPESKTLEKYWNDNKLALVNYLRYTHMGIKGLIEDSETRKPLQGVFINVHGNKKYTLSNDLGEYFRLLPPGGYMITFELDDYESVTKKVIVDNRLNHAGVHNITMKRLLAELKTKNVQTAKLNEIENSKNKNFTGVYRLIKDDFDSVPTFKYHNYDEMLGYLLYFNEKYKNMTWLYRITNMASSNTNRQPYAIVIASDNPHNHKLLRPEFKFVAQTNSDHLIGKELLLLLIKYLLENYGKDKEITKLINTTRIHIIPSFMQELSEKEFKKSLSNDTSSVSLSQNNTCQIDRKNSTDTRSTVLNWVDDYSFVLSGTLYDGQLLARIPWNSFKKDDKNRPTYKTADDELFRKLAKSYISKNNKMLKAKGGCPNDPCANELKTKMKDGIINGAMWKNTSNTIQDLHYIYDYCFDISLYISCELRPNESKLIDYWLNNKKSMINFIKQVHNGVKGLLFDENTKELIQEKQLTLSTGNQKEAMINTPGDYFRLFAPGEYNITIKIQGYENTTKHIKIGEQVEILNIMLRKKSKKFMNRKKLDNANLATKSTNYVIKLIGYLILIGLISLIVYYIYKILNQKFNLRGFHQLFDEMNDDNLLMPLETEFSLNKMSILKKNQHINLTDDKNDDIVLLDKS